VTQVLEVRQSVLLEFGHTRRQRAAPHRRRRRVRGPRDRETSRQSAQLRRLAEEAEDLLPTMSAGLGHQGRLQVGAVLRHQDRKFRRRRPVRAQILLQEMERGRLSGCRIVAAGHARSQGICAGKSDRNNKFRNLIIFSICGLQMHKLMILILSSGY